MHEDKDEEDVGTVVIEAHKMETRSGEASNSALSALFDWSILATLRWLWRVAIISAVSPFFKGSRGCRSKNKGKERGKREQKYTVDEENDRAA